MAATSTSGPPERPEFGTYAVGGATYRYVLGGADDPSLAAPPAAAGAGAGAEEADEKTASAAVQRSVEVPKKRMGALLGRKGSNLRALEAQHACRVETPRRNDPSTTVVVRGADDASVAACVAAIEALAL